MSRYFAASCLFALLVVPVGPAGADRAIGPWRSSADRGPGHRATHRDHMLHVVQALVEAHPDGPLNPSYHHNRHTLLSAYLLGQLAPYLGLTAAEQRFWVQAALMHDVDPEARRRGQRPQPVATARLMRRDFNRRTDQTSPLVSKHQGSYLRNQFGWNHEVQLLKALVLVARSRHPFGETADMSPEQRNESRRARRTYRAAVRRLDVQLSDMVASGEIGAQQRETELRTTLQVSALFSEYCDKGSLYFGTEPTTGFAFESLSGLAAELAQEAASLHGHSFHRQYHETLGQLVEHTPAPFIGGLGRTNQGRPGESVYAYDVATARAHGLGELNLPRRATVLRWLPRWALRHKLALFGHEHLRRQLRYQATTALARAGTNVGDPSTKTRSLAELLTALPASTLQHAWNKAIDSTLGAIKLTRRKLGRKYLSQMRRRRAQLFRTHEGNFGLNPFNRLVSAHKTSTPNAR